MSDEDYKTLKDVALGLVIGSCLAIVAWRCIELGSRSYVEASNISAAERIPQGQDRRASSCESSLAVLR